MSDTTQEHNRQAVRLRAALYQEDDATLGAMLAGGTSVRAAFAQRVGCGDLPYSVIEHEFTAHAARQLRRLADGGTL
jgi:hypothetical protein